MRKYIEIDNSGNILRYGVCSTKAFLSRKESGEKIVEVDSIQKGMDNNQKYINGKIVERTEAEMAAMAEK